MFFFLRVVGRWRRTARVQVPELGIEGQRTLQLAPEQFVIGFSRGYASGKSVFIWPSDVGAAWARVRGGGGQGAQQHHLRSEGGASKHDDGGNSVPRGVMFWNINNDGGPVNGTSTTCSFTKEFNEWLHVRG